MYFASKTEEFCFNGAHGFTGAESVLSFEDQIEGLDHAFNQAEENGIDLCQTSDIESHIADFTADILSRKDEGRDQTVILIVGTKDNIEAETIRNFRENGVDVFGVLIGGKWENFLDGTVRSGGGQTIPFTMRSQFFFPKFILKISKNDQI